MRIPGGLELLRRAGLGASALLLAAAPLHAGRTIAIGDIHGALQSFVEILDEAGLIDDQRNWAGGHTRLVQTGDYTDRGSEVRAVMDLLMKLQDQAGAAGGEVRVLLGNHEMLNLMRHDADVRVNPRIYASFADARSEARHRAGLETWRRWWVETAESRAAPTPEPTELDVQKWEDVRPPGFFAYHEALGPKGRYGAWLRTLPVVYRSDDTIFLHGGLSHEFLQLTLEQINRLHRSQIEILDDTVERLEKKGVVPPLSTWDEMMAELNRVVAADASRKSLKLAQEALERLDRFTKVTAASNTPLWYRGYAQPPQGLTDEELAELLEELVSAYGARHFVTAHSPFHGDEIAVRLGGGFFLIDTGMLKSVYGGRPSALEIGVDGFNALYPGQRRPLVTGEPSGEAVGQTPHGHAAQRRGSVALALAAAGPRPLLAALAPEEEGQESADWEPPPRRLLDRDGRPLGFSSFEEVEDFLRRADIVGRKKLTMGKTGALRLELEHQGRRARAVFHSIDDRRNPAGAGEPVRLSGGSLMLRFRDSYTSQVAAYRLAQLMGLDNVPPAVLREVDGEKGSLALWIEGGTTLTDWNESHQGRPADRYFNQQFYDMRAFDALINNKDRNTGNILWTPDMNLWLIDHTRSFAQDKSLYKEEFVQRCSRDLLRRIQALDEDEVKEALKPYLSVFEIKALFKRRSRLLNYLRDRMEKLGEERVLFEYGPLEVKQTPVTSSGAAA